MGVAFRWGPPERVVERTPLLSRVVPRKPFHGTPHGMAGIMGALMRYVPANVPLERGFGTFHQLSALFTLDFPLSSSSPAWVICHLPRQFLTSLLLQRLQQPVDFGLGWLFLVGRPAGVWAMLPTDIPGVRRRCSRTVFSSRLAWRTSVSACASVWSVATTDMKWRPLASTLFLSRTCVRAKLIGWKSAPRILPCQCKVVVSPWASPAHKVRLTSRPKGGT